ncbi:hypothetical protein DFP73DRAFT_563252 [Morchella snyderi]|nr:hypothetical protein DFP73DRAFT_563252 [Morchella snyderi]
MILGPFYPRNLGASNFLVVFVVTVVFQSLLVRSQQLDPIKNVCSRWDHQSAILNGKLYIDGGVEVFVDLNSTGEKQPGTQQVGTNKNLLSLDMTQQWSWRDDDMPLRVLDDQKQQQSTRPPSLTSGALWPWKNFLYLFGGTTNRLNDSFVGHATPTTDDVVMWKYDIEKTIWAPISFRNNSAIMLRLFNGASTVVSNQGLAFHLGGVIDNGTLPVSGSGVSFVNSFYAFNLTDESASKLGTDGLGDTSYRTNAQMVNIPDLGSKGILVLLGGGYKNSSANEMDWKGDLISMSNIGIFDINSIAVGGTWYNQTATGDVPSPRIDFCMVIVSAPDKSSHNIFIYGGWDGVNNFDQVYVLSIPSFRWIKIFEGKDERRSHTCHVVGNRQLMTVGGRRGRTLPGECDWQPNTISLFDMVTLDWVPEYKPNGTKWEVPKPISDKIGGGFNGDATLNAPETWAPGLEAVFMSGEIYPGPETASLEPARKTLSKPAVIGLSVSLSLAVLLAMFIIYYLYHHFCIKNSSSYSQPAEPELPAKTPPPNGVFQELFSSLGMQRANVVADAPRHPAYGWPRMRGGDRNPFEVSCEGVNGRNSMATGSPVVEKPEGNWI